MMKLTIATAALAASGLSARAAATREITALSALDLSRAIHDRKLSCVEVMTAYLDHIEAVNPRVNAIVAMRPRDALLAEAAEADADLAAGRDRGWLHGIPQAPKDLTATRGMVTTQGFRGLVDNVPKADSALVARTRAAGELERFFATFDLPVLAYLRDTQVYVQATAAGMTLFDLPPSRAERDVEQWQAIIDWVERGEPVVGD